MGSKCCFYQGLHRKSIIISYSALFSFRENPVVRGLLFLTFSSHRVSLDDLSKTTWLEPGGAAAKRKCCTVAGLQVATTDGVQKTCRNGVLGARGGDGSFSQHPVHFRWLCPSQMRMSLRLLLQWKRKQTAVIDDLFAVPVMTIIWFPSEHYWSDCWFRFEFFSLWLWNQ